MNKLYRSRTDSKLTGLCGGLAAYFGIDSTIVRLAMVIGGVFSLGTVLMIYIIAAIVIPKEPGIEGFYKDNPYHY
ncbi:PspC domain-containing protein [Paenibacillus mendelii]|uniref:PspC domain-containing protein n=1 Tax=Paenibacillus mendelii TaxID=206163 RepID=A0ABV6JED1_9BACL|nr:PspC domain-containing protein [Paenibacillus mendelii]MCQ6562422.1 PspC domain-containing protein [Paenibacillus mendelii]